MNQITMMAESQGDRQSSTVTETVTETVAETVTAMANTSLDISNHSVSTPVPTNDDKSLMLTMPLSPNAVEQFPVGLTSSLNCSEGAGTQKTNNTSRLDDIIPASLPLPCSSNNSDCSSLATSIATVTKCVRFSPMVRVKDVLSRYEMSLEERHDYWLQNFEFLMIKRRNQKTVQKFLQSSDQESETVTSTATESEDNRNMPQHSSAPESTIDSEDDEEECCLRGLEAALPNENLRRRSYRFAALDEVFLEQDDQYFAGIYDDEAIAEVYLEVSVECRFRAEFRGIQDRKAIEEYLQEGQPLAFGTTASATAENENTSHGNHNVDEFAL